MPFCKNLRFSRRNVSRRLHVQPLEARLLLAGNIALVDGELIIHGDNESNQIAVSVSASGERLHVSLDGRSVSYPNAEVKHVSIFGHRGNDRIANRDNVRQAALIDGGAGNDQISGGLGDDFLIGGAGSDTVHGGGGDDLLLGDHRSLQDPLDEEALEAVTSETPHHLLAIEAMSLTTAEDESVSYDDVLNGGAGADVMLGMRGHDGMDGGRGDDLLIGGRGNDRIDGNEGNDKLYGGAGNDGLAGSVGNDLIRGGDGDDLIHGGQGDDALAGGDGKDEIFGGRGDDRLSGGGGRDYLDGGEGNDWVHARDGVVDVVFTDGLDRLLTDPEDLIQIP